MRSVITTRTNKLRLLPALLQEPKLSLCSNVNFWKCFTFTVNLFYNVTNLVRVECQNLLCQRFLRMYQNGGPVDTIPSVYIIVITRQKLVLPSLSNYQFIPVNMNGIENVVDNNKA